MNKTSLRNRRFSIWIIVAGFAVIVLAVSGYYWFSQDQEESKEFTGIRETVRISTTGPGSSLIMIAEEQGLFTQQGLDVTVKEYPSGKRSLEEGIFVGEVDVAHTAETPIVFNSFERQDFSIVATIGSSDNAPRIIARKDQTIQKPGDLRGKRIATQEVSSVHFFLHLFLVKYGLSEKDVNLSFKKAEDLPAALARGEIDAFSMREPFISEASTLLGDNAVIFAEPGLYLKTFNLVASNSMIKDKPEVISRILLALIQAEEFAKNHPDQAIKIVSNKLGVEESVIAALWPGLDLGVSLDQSLLLSLEDEARWVIESELTDRTEVPNHLDFIYPDGLEAVKPEAVTIIR